MAPGTSRVSFRIIVSQTALAQGDLRFEKIKGKAYPGSGYRGLSPLLDPTNCDEEFGGCIQDEDQVPFY